MPKLSWQIRTDEAIPKLTISEFTSNDKQWINVQLTHDIFKGNNWIDEAGVEIYGPATLMQELLTNALAQVNVIVAKSKP